MVITRPVLLAVLVLTATLVPPIAQASDEPPPTDLVATRGDGRIVLTWTPAAAPLPSHYRIYAQTTTGEAVVGLAFPGGSSRFVHDGLDDGVTRTYRVAAVRNGTESSSGYVTESTFARTTRHSTFGSGPDGFGGVQTGGGTVAWSSSYHALVVTQPVGGSAADTVLARPLGATWTDDDSTFSVNATVRQVSSGYRSTFWAVGLAPATSPPGELGSLPGFAGIMVDDNVDVEDGGHGVRFFYRDPSGQLILNSSYELCYDCDLVEYRVGLSYDARTRMLSYLVHHAPSGRTYSEKYAIGTLTTDAFAFDRLVVATDKPSEYRTAVHTVDDLEVTWKHAEAVPTQPRPPTAERVAGTPSSIALEWGASQREGAEPVRTYVVMRDDKQVATRHFYQLDHVDATSGRWARHEYRIHAVSEMGMSPQSARVVVGSDQGVHAESLGIGQFFPSTWIEERDYFGDSRISTPSSGVASLGFNDASHHRRAALLDGHPWTDRSGSFYAESHWRDTGQGARVGACPLALVPATGKNCEAAGSIVGQFRAENRSAPITGGQTTRALLRFVDDAGVERIAVSHPVQATVDYRFNFTYDVSSRLLTLRLLDANGTLLASGSHTLAPTTRFSVGHVGMVAGLAPYASNPQYGRLEVSHFRFGFASPSHPGVPGAPLAPALNATGADEVTVSWPAVPGATKYAVYRAARFTTSTRALVGHATDTTLVDTESLRGQDVRYQVAALNADGEGLLSPTSTVRTWAVPAKPSMSSTVTGPDRGEITVRWPTPAADPGGAPVLGFLLTRDTGEHLATLGPEARSWVDTGLPDGATRRYQLRVFNAVGTSAISNQAIGTTASLASAGLYPVTVGGVGQAQLRWAITGALVNESLVYRAIGDAPLTLHATVAAPTMTFNDTGLPDGADVRYAVRVRNVVGTGPLSGERSVTLPDVPSAPQNLAAARGPGLGEVSLSWSAPASHGGLPVTGYVVTRDGAPVATLNATSWRATGLAGDVVHAWGVAAVNAVGTGAAATVEAAAPGLPSVPQTVQAEPGPNLGGIRLTWHASADNGGLAIKGYRIYRVGPSGPMLLALVSGLPTYDDTGLPDATTVSYQIAAVTSAGEGPRANVEGRTWARIAPEPVLNLTAIHAGFGNVRVSWTAPEANEGQPAQRYQVYRIGGVQGERLAATVTGTGWLDTFSQWQSQPAPDYRYRVVPLNEAGAGPERVSGAASWLR